MLLGNIFMMKQLYKFEIRGRAKKDKPVDTWL
jgi:hypothetical protein